MLRSYSEFYLQYDGEADPNIRFGIDLGGLTEFDKPIPLPPIYFEPAKIHEFDAVFPSMGF